MTHDIKCTEIKLTPGNEAELGTATVVLDDCLMLRGLRIVDGINGPFVGYPRIEGSACETFVTPLTRDIRESIETAVLAKYRG